MLVCAVSIAVGIAGTLLLASDFVGVYAKVDRVVIEPNADAPEAVQIWGVFSVAQGRAGSGYLPAARGYLYFKMPATREAARREWLDLARLAGKGGVVAFGSRYNAAPPRVRPESERPANPDVYSTNVGLTSIDSSSGYPPVRALFDVRP